MKRIALVPAAVATASLLAAMVFAQGMPPTLVETSAVAVMEFHDQITLVGKTEARATRRRTSLPDAGFASSPIFPTTAPAAS